jgi:ubiquinone/menaquinone biosynthesis C-methylase UbiE
MSWIGKYKTFWQNRMASRGEDRMQTTKVCHVLRQRLTDNPTFASAIDLGCGNGRFLPLLSAFCQHTWAIDILPQLVPCIVARSVSSTPYIVTEPFQLPDGPHDFLFACFLFQHLVDDDVFAEVTTELRRVLKPGARVIIIDNAMDKAAHVRPRTADDFIKSLALSTTTIAKRVTVNKRENDHWIVDGVVVQPL